MQWKKLKVTYNGLEFYQMRAHLCVARMDLISSRNVWVCIGRQFNMNPEISQCDMVCIQRRGLSCLPLRTHKIIAYLY